MLFLAMQELMKNVLLHERAQKFRVVWTTGPGAIQDGFNAFLRKRKGGKVRAGNYVGIGNRFFPD